MLELAGKLVLDDKAILAPNLCDKFSSEDLDKIGDCVWEGYAHDKRSREKWERRTQAAMDLAMQVQKDKSFPWPGCSNVAFPLITISALQFHSRAYPAIISGNDIVKCRIIGEDPSGQKTKRADRIATHMSWQKLEEQPEWEEQKDRLLINLPIVGTTFVKSYYDSKKRKTIDETVLAQDLVIDYWAKSLESCPRKTHTIPFFRNDLHSAIKSGIFRDVSEESWYRVESTARREGQAAAKQDNRTGQTPGAPDFTTPYICLEQHVDLDLDGDGYAEPYIITVEETSKCVLRIVCGFDRPEDVLRNKAKEIISICRTEYFTKYEFIPSPDGGIYGVGFGVLLGPLNESTSTLINQMIDAGTMQTTKGGFLSRGAKMRGGTYTFSPFSWQRVDSTGDDLRKNIVPLEVGEPSTVLFQLLGLLINYVERISGTTDPMVGENPGQNTTAETMRTMVQEGQRIYSAVFKRIWRSMKEEFKKDYILNGIYMSMKKSFGQGQFALREDYLGNPDEIAPAADPNLTSEQMALAQAMTLKQFAASTPGYDADAVERRVLKLMKVDQIDLIFPGVAKTGAPKDIKLQIAELKQQSDMAWLEADKAKFAMGLQEEIRLNDVQIARWIAEIDDMRATTQGDEADRHIALVNAMLGSLKTRNDVLMKHLDVLMKSMEVKRAEVENGAGGDTGNVRRLVGASGNSGAKTSPRTQAA